jgi:WD40 repeat protein
MNPTYMVMDATGAVWLTDDYRYQTGLVRVIAGIAQVVVSGPSDGFCGIAISPAGTLCVSGNTDGTNKTIREYDLNDDLLQGEFATSASYDVLAFGHGGSFGSDLYAMSLHGDLYRLGSNGNAIPVGSGFQAPVDSKFGSDGNLYVSEDTEGRVLQITSDASAVSPWATTRSPGSSSVSVFPNPSRGVTKIGLALGTTQPEICVGAFDVEGRQIRSLHSGPLTAGAHTISWNGVDTCGRHCANGTYYVQIHALGTQLQTKFVRTD